MLHCIIGMVDKTKRALAVLQERSLRDREELSTWMRRHAEGMDHDMKKRHNEMMAHTLRQTEDRVSEVKRRAGGSGLSQVYMLMRFVLCMFGMCEAYGFFLSRWVWVALICD